MFLEANPGDFPVATAKLGTAQAEMASVLAGSVGALAPVAAAGNEVSALASAFFSSYAVTIVESIVDELAKIGSSGATLTGVGAEYFAGDLTSGANIATEQAQFL